MKRIITHFSALALVAGLGAFATSCTPTTSGPTGNGVGAPSGIKVNSLSSTSIGVTWLRGTSDVGADTIVGAPTDGTAPVMTISTSTQSSGVLNGLTDGKSYAISVRSSGGSSASTTWAPADRTTGVITLYEAADNTPGHFSGLNLDNSNISAVSINGGSNAADIVLGSDNTISPSGIFLASAGVQGSGIAPGVAKVTLMNSSTALVTGGLDSDYYSGDLSSLIPGTSLTDPNAFTSVDFTGTAAGTLGASDPSHDAILRVKTSTGHYARIDIIRQPSGLLWRQVGTHNAIDVRVSEQSVANLPYAARGTKFYPNPVIARQSTNRTYMAN